MPSVVWNNAGRCGDDGKRRGFSRIARRVRGGHIHVPGWHSIEYVSCFGVGGTPMDN